MLYTKNFHLMACQQTVLPCSDETPVRGSERKKEEGQIPGGKKWMLHHKNAPAHSFPSNYLRLSHKAHHTYSTTSILTKSPTNRFLLVPEVEIRTERLNIESDDNIQENSQTKLRAFPQKNIPAMLPKADVFIDNHLH